MEIQFRLVTQIHINCVQELETYLSQLRSITSEDIILQCWKLNQVHFTVLANIARDFSSI